jgi:hypothetical protein
MQNAGVSNVFVAVTCGTIAKYATPNVKTIATRCLFIPETFLAVEVDVSPDYFRRLPQDRAFLSRRHLN